MPSMTKLSRMALAAMASVSTFALVPSAQAGTVKPMWGSVSPLWGSVSPLWGSVSPLWGSVSPLWGSVSPLWGSVSPLWGSVSPLDGSSTQLNPYTAPTSSINGVSAFWGTTVPYTNNMTAAGLNTYWLNTGVTMKNIDTAWAAVPAGAPASSYASVVTQLNALGTNAATFWNPAIKAKTGGIGYKATVSDPLLAKYGINLDNPTTLGTLDQTKRAQFFLEFYDRLMDYTGTDHIDYWMNLVNWSPSLTQTQGSAPTLPSACWT